ncbi:hypothetical protein FLP10_11975 [Agromyces intestinalis]|uniref:Uncharacterized protein n=1 Tax=Agromyces intestinalis TaxID=2592652 RepID=A0A5C1YJQ2_9MICO|nr:hypothetical protein [Agromyces intestinalis]QEO15052.1 hypothetical protein FLP10_11975 [Agromyces intestinalis]
MTHHPDRPELTELLDEERRLERRPTRAARVLVFVAAAGLVVAAGAGATLAASAANSVAEYDARMTTPASDDALDEASAAPVADPAATEATEVPDSVAPSTGGTSTTDPAPSTEATTTVEGAGIPGAVGTNAAGSPIFDASTDIAVIPRLADSHGDDPANTEIWLTQQGIIADCMLEAGFTYTFTPYWLRVEGDWGTGWAGYTDEFKLALDGAPDRPLGDDYDWTTAGCIGYAVHVTGMDDAH